MPTLDKLLAGPHSVVLAVSQPDRPRGRGRVRQPSPVSRLALEREIPLLRPERVAAPEVESALRDASPDVGVVVAFGQFLPRRIREAPTCGYLVNGHASVLPAYRGAAPIARAILAGETSTGISVMRVEREMDAGPVAWVRSLEIGPDETEGELSPRLAALAADAIAGVLDLIADGRVTWTPQDPAQASVAPKIRREESEIDWHEPAVLVARRVRALSPRPGAHTTWSGELLRILSARSAPGPVDDLPGTVRGDARELRVATGDGWLLPRRLQRTGGRALDVESFLRGRPIPDGTRLGESGATARLDP